MTCKTCKYLHVPKNKQGRRVIHPGSAYKCEAPAEPLPILPHSVTKGFGFHWPLGRAYMTGEDGINCPLHEGGTDSTATCNTAPLTDKDRLDVLQSLVNRTEYQNKKHPTRTVSSDMQLGDGTCRIHVRNLFGNPVASSDSTDVREAIDIIAARCSPN